MSGLKQHSKYGTKKRSLSTPYKTKIRLQDLVFKITHYTQKHDQYEALLTDRSKYK